MRFHYASAGPQSVEDFVGVTSIARKLCFIIFLFSIDSITWYFQTNWTNRRISSHLLCSPPWLVWCFEWFSALLLVHFLLPLFSCFDIHCCQCLFRSCTLFSLQGPVQCSWGFGKMSRGLTVTVASVGPYQYPTYQTLDPLPVWHMMQSTLYSCGAFPMYSSPSFLFLFYINLPQWWLLKLSPFYFTCCPSAFLWTHSVAVLHPRWLLSRWALLCWVLSRWVLSRYGLSRYTLSFCMNLPFLLFHIVIYVAPFPPRCRISVSLHFSWSTLSCTTFRYVAGCVFIFRALQFVWYSCILRFVAL